MKENWYAIYTKPNCEKKVSALLGKRKIENFYPLNRVVINSQANRKKTAYEVLMPGIVFVRITDGDVAVIKQLNYVLNFMYWLGKPAVISSEEIANMKQFSSEYSNITLQKTTVKPNETGRIISEPHIDYNGKLITVKNIDIQLSLPSIGYIMAAAVEKSNIDIFNYGFERSNLVS